MIIDELLKSVLNSCVPESYMLEFYDDDEKPIVFEDKLTSVKFRICDNKYIIMPLRFDGKDLMIHNLEYLQSLLSEPCISIFLKNHILISYDDNLDVRSVNNMKQKFRNNLKKYDALRIYALNEEIHKWEVKYDRRCDTFSID